VLYNELTREDGFQSKEFAQLCLEEVTKVTNKVNRGLVTGEDVVIINKAKMPVSLIEVGFMSNYEELNFLLQEDNRKKIATSIYNAILRAYEGN
jgi:N-acetylmuramoyl-L-alanine amidase